MVFVHSFILLPLDINPISCIFATETFMDSDEYTQTSQIEGKQPKKYSKMQFSVVW